MESFRDVIALWGTPDAMAEAIGVNVHTARKWRTRDSIPADWWQRILEVAQADNKPVTADDLARIAAKPENAETAA